MRANHFSRRYVLVLTRWHPCPPFPTLYRSHHLPLQPVVTRGDAAEILERGCESA